MATQWTEEQRQAIENRGGTLLVSAAAGSGKTAVLVERVLRRLTDDTNPVDIDRFLMVTYTNAAAAELRGKLSDALTARAAAAPEDKRLRRQLFLVHRAQITTVHAFCLSLARDQFTALDLTPDFRVADESETGPILDETMEALLEARYEAGDAAFLALSDLLTAGRDDKRLHEVILETYHKIQAHPEPHAFLEHVRQGYEQPIGALADTPHGKVLLEEARVAVEYGAGRLDRAIADMEGDDVLRDAYLPAFLADRARAGRLLDTIAAGDWDGAVAGVQEVAFDRLGSTRGYEDKEHLEALKALREEWKSVVKKLRERILCVTEAQAEDDRVRTAPAMGALIDAVEDFTAAYSAEKRRRGLVDFGDLEHFAIRLLYEGGQPSALARTLSRGFVEVLVDEYQDTNAVQDAIFRAVSDDGARLFMVGDVKQSIYSFRLANPYIFLQKYLTFTDAAQAGEGQPRRVVLSRNFRSRAQVLQAANAVFRAVMSASVGDVEYGAREALYPGADYPDAENPCYDTEVCVVDLSKDEDGNAPDKTEAEARVVAQRIAQLLHEGFLVYDKALGRQRPAVASDCTILLRSVKRKAAVYAAALEAVGLAAQTDDSTGLLAATEVRAVVSLLSVIDNPRQDIELIGALRSPLLGFTEQQLADIHLHARDACFYDALVLAAAEDEHAALFLQQLARWRLLAADLPMWQMIELLYDETGAMGIYGALPNGARRQANLLAFFERARAYEAQGHRGLFRFLCLVRGMLANGEDFPAPAPSADGGAVRILSIHKSKGLEFPVVFLADCAKTFNETDLYAPILVHSELGFGPKCRDMERGIQYPSLWRLAIAAQARREQVSEELRILYVGMTRARDKMVITCASGSAASSLRKWAPLAQEERIPPYALGAARSTALWLLAPLLRHPQAQPLRDLAGVTLAPAPDLPECFSFTCVRAQSDEQNEQDQAENETAHEQTANALRVPATQPYEAPFLQDIPAKLTATGVKKGFKAEEASEDAPPAVKPERVLRRPFFDRAARGLTPSEVGTAHHLFMQFADFAACETVEGVQAECARLADKHILAREQADAIDASRIAAFFGSALYQEQMKRGRVRREFKFSVLAPAARFYPVAQSTPDEQVLLQGVIDCMIEHEDGMCIVDFKNDRVRAGNAAERAESYRAQLDAYAYAVEQIFDKPVKQKYLYFFATKQSYLLD